MYIIQDTKLEKLLRLPHGKYDIPLLLDAHYFTARGNISDVSMERTSVYGDTFTVNGAILPYLSVEPRKYRFRLLDASASRTFNLTLKDGALTIPFWVIGSDSGLRETPVQTRSLVLAMAERWEVSFEVSTNRHWLICNNRF